MPSLSFLVVEIASLVLFFFALLEVRKQGAGRMTEFLMIFFYALILEELDMRIFKSYHYGSGFYLMAGQVPVCIAFLWAVIVAGAMSISDFLGIPETARPFMDALLAVWLDLAIDAIAIRMGYWKWAIPLNQGWFGVPAGNLYAWMWVAFFFSVLARAVRHLISQNPKWIAAYLAVPFISYAGLYVQLNLIGFAGKVFGLTSQNQRLILFAFQFIIFLIIVAANWGRRLLSTDHLSPVWLISRLVIHLYFLIGFFAFGIFRGIPILGVIAVLILAAEVLFFKKVSYARS